MAQLSARDSAVLLEAIGICIDHGNPGLGSQISQWLATVRATAPTLFYPPAKSNPPRIPLAEMVAKLEAQGGPYHARPARPHLRLVRER